MRVIWSATDRIMASILEIGTASLPLRVLEEESASGGDPTDAVLFFGISLVLGIACRHALRGDMRALHCRFACSRRRTWRLRMEHIIGWEGLATGFVYGLILILIFSWLCSFPHYSLRAQFSMEVHQIKRCMVQMFLLAVPGVLISTFCIGAALKLVFLYNWSWKTSLLLGGLLGATDPVAVIALLKELEASKKLSTIIEGESLMNDGMVLGWNFNWGGVVKFLSQVTLGAVTMGLAFGIASVLWLGFIFNDTIIEISLTLAVSYLSFFTAQEGLEISGILAVMTLGMFYYAVARTAFKGESQQSLHHFWEMVSYIANT